MPVPKNVSTTTAPKDEAWNAPTLNSFTSDTWDSLSDAQKRKIMGHFAWSPSLAPADVTYTELKLPHHDPKTGSVNWRGVTGAAEAVQGARGGVDIPESDLSAVKAHLAAHYRQFNATAPWEKAAPAPVNTKNLSEFKNITLTSAKMDTAGTGTFEGYASTFGNKDLQDDIVQPGAFKKTISDNNGTFRLLDQHDIKTEIGLVRATEDARGLYVKGEFYIDPSGDPTNEIKAAREAYVKMQRRQAAGMPLQMSIGYRAINPTYKNGARLLGEVALAEVSLVTFPANPLAETTSVKDFTEDYQERIDRWQPGMQMDAAFGALRDAIGDALNADDGDNDPESMKQLAADLDGFKTVVLTAVTAMRALPHDQMDIASADLRRSLKEIFTDTPPEPGNHSEKAAGENEPPFITALTEFVTDLKTQPSRDAWLEAVAAIKRDARTHMET